MPCTADICYSNMGMKNGAKTSRCGCVNFLFRDGLSGSLTVPNGAANFRGSCSVMHSARWRKNVVACYYKVVIKSRLPPCVRVFPGLHMGFHIVANVIKTRKLTPRYLRGAS